MLTSRDPDYLEFVANLRRARKASSLTQEQLASQLGKPQSFVAKVETCERRIDLLETAHWAIATKRPVLDLLPIALRRKVDVIQATTNQQDE